MAEGRGIWPDRFFVDLDRDGPTPLYHAISARLEEAIHAGALPPGTRLENEIAISERLGVSRPTVRRAIQELVNGGLLVRRRGVGTQVVQSRMTRPVELTSLFDDLTAAHRAPTTRVLDLGTVAAPADIADSLGIDAGSPLLSIRRLRFMDGIPVALLHNHLPSHIASVTESDLTERGLYQLLRSHGVSLRVASQTIGARPPHGDEQALLGIAPGVPVLTMQRTAYDDSGRAVEFGDHRYRSDLYRFETTLVAR